MKNHEIVIILSILSMHYNFATTKGVEENDPIDLRIRNLKRELLKDQSEAELHDYREMDLDYVDNSNKPITPINEYDQRKKDERYKQPELKSTTTEKYVASPENSTEELRPLRIHPQQYQHNKKLAQKQSRKPKAEIFYRRAFDTSKDRNRPQKWTHCLDLLSPYLNGYLSNVSKSKIIYSTDTSVKRLTYLLRLNMTDVTTDEIKATLYEISNIPMRMYQWDVSAVKTILRTVIKDGPNDFRGLKYGFKDLFRSWKLNTSNLTKLLTQSRVFRPPCIQINEFGGSTVSKKAVQFTKPDQIGDYDDVTKCARRDEDC